MGDTFKNVHNLVDMFVKAVRPKEKDAVMSVDWKLVAILCLGMILLTSLDETQLGRVVYDVPLQVRTTALLLINIIIRLMYPSQYCPATASRPGIIASPVTARCIAFVAEYSMYEVWAVWIGVKFWDDTTYLWALVLFGEILSTFGVLLQNEFMLFCEDSTWAIHALYMTYLTKNRPIEIFIFGGLGAYLLFCHLPSRFNRMLKKIRMYNMGVFNVNPLFIKQKVVIRKCSEKEKLWVVPMLLGMPCLMMLMYREINQGLLF